ncbi:MAG: hypothetical protein ACKV19_14290 [Verrucomicrobiales bacterium]
MAVPGSTSTENAATARPVAETVQDGIEVAHQDATTAAQIAGLDASMTAG